MWNWKGGKIDCYCSDGSQSVSGKGREVRLTVTAQMVESVSVEREGR